MNSFNFRIVQIDCDKNRIRCFALKLQDSTPDSYYNQVCD
jgi:hypothetical protein